MPNPAILLGLLLAVFSGRAVLARQAPPVLRANSAVVDVRDGDKLWKGVWTIDPAIELDVYDASRSDRGKTITFITDVESMSFNVEPGHTYDFTILLNGKDACRTRISTMMQGCTRTDPDAAEPETIPITISHGKLHLTGTINGSRPLDLIFDTGADTNVLYPSGAEKGVTLRFDGTVNNAGTGGITRRRTSSDNRLQVGRLLWTHEPVMFVEKQADSADGILGYRAFEDKVIELDYDRMVLVVHDTLPAHAANFAKTAMIPVGSLTAIDAVLVVGDTQARGPFVLDTGGTGTMMVNQAFATSHALRGTLERLGTSTSRGVGSAAVRNEVMRLPGLSIAGFTMPGVPIHVEVTSDGNPSAPGGALCMDVLMRFNTILDYPHSAAYLNANARFDTPFRSGVSGFTAALAGIAILAVALLTALVVHRTRARTAAQRSPTP